MAKREPQIDITGQIFGKLTVERYAPASSAGERSTWVCRCSCGNYVNHLYSKLANGNPQSCGCHLKENPLGSHEYVGNQYRTTKEYRAWQGIKQRCLNKKATNYNNYGGRGINICSEWLNSFFSFLKDMGMAPSKDFSIERKDVNGDYSKENCKWASRKEQQNNRRCNLIISYEEREMTGAEFCDKYEICQYNFYRAIKKGKSPSEILNDSKRLKEEGKSYNFKKRIIQMNLEGEVIKEWSSLGEVAKFFGVKNASTLRKYIKNEKAYKGFKWIFSKDFS